jgi:hypothetical protein
MVAVYGYNGDMERKMIVTRTAKEVFHPTKRSIDLAFIKEYISKAPADVQLAILNQLQTLKRVDLKRTDGRYVSFTKPGKYGYCFEIIEGSPE